jgi:hypothetical protein
VPGADYAAAMTSSSASGIDLERLCTGRRFGSVTTPDVAGTPGLTSSPSPSIDSASASFGLGAQRLRKDVAGDVPDRRCCDGEGEDRPASNPGERPTDHDREHDERRVELDGVALDLRDGEQIVLDLLDDQIQREGRDDRLDAGSRRQQDGGMAEMIGPMIGNSSRMPAVTESRIAYRPKIGSTVATQDEQPDEREHADRHAEDQLRPDPLAE